MKKHFLYRSYLFFILFFTDYSNPNETGWIEEFLLLRSVGNFLSFDHPTNRIIKELGEHFFGLPYENNEDSAESLFEQKKIHEKIKEIYHTSSIDFHHSINARFCAARYHAQQDITEQISLSYAIKLLIITSITSRLLPMHHEIASLLIYPFPNIQEWEEAIEFFLLQIAEVGMKEDGYFYNEFDNELVNKLEKNEKYKFYTICAPFFSSIFDDKCHHIITKECYKNYDELLQKSIDTTIQHFSHRLPILIKKITIEYINQTFINQIFPILTNKDILFTLYFFSRIGNSTNATLLNLSHPQHVIICAYGTLCRFILDSLFTIHGLRTIKWNDLPILPLNQEIIQPIIEQTALLAASEDLIGHILPSIFNDSQN